MQSLVIWKEDTRTVHHSVYASDARHLKISAFSISRSQSHRFAKATTHDTWINNSVASLLNAPSGWSTFVRRDARVNVCVDGDRVDIACTGVCVAHAVDARSMATEG